MLQLGDFVKVARQDCHEPPSLGYQAGGKEVIVAWWAPLLEDAQPLLEDLYLRVQEVMSFHLFVVFGIRLGQFLYLQRLFVIAVLEVGVLDTLLGLAMLELNDVVADVVILA